MSANLDNEVISLMRAIAAGDTTVALRLLGELPALTTTRIEKGATRNGAERYHLDAIGHYVFAGTTALHIAAAAYQDGLVRRLLSLGADIHAKDRRGAEPIHLAAMGMPGSHTWNPRAQVATIACLLQGGADPNGVDKNGATALHRAVRTRCAAAVKTLLDGGADPQRKNKNGSIPALLATRTTGRGGTGLQEAKEQQRQILLLLQQYGPNDR